MSGIYIHGMEMPTSCCECVLAKLSPTGESLFCNYTLSTVPWDDKPFDCPLIPVPKHGDLIDYDFCMGNYELLHDDDGNPVYAVRMREINAAPTIIPADKEEEG